MSTDLSKLLQVNPLFFSLISVSELVDFYRSDRFGAETTLWRGTPVGAPFKGASQPPSGAFFPPNLGPGFSPCPASPRPRRKNTQETPDKPQPLVS